MQARLSAVQRTLIVVTIVALTIAAIVLPAPDNADYRRALAELTSLQRRFDRTNVEAALLEHAKAQGRQPLAPLTQQISTLRPISVQVPAQAPAVEPIGALKIATLADIDRYAQPGVTLPLRVADLSTVASSLAWRLTREAPKDTPITLANAQLRAAAIEPAAVELEAQIAGLQNDQQAARAAAERASAQLTSITTLYENRIKWRVSRQLRNDTYKTLLEARKAQRDADRALRDVDKRYEAAVAKAAPAAKGKTATINDELGVLDVDLRWAATGKHYEIPVRVKAVQAQLPPLQGVSLRQTHAAGLWDEVKDLEAAGAARTVVQRFNWHQQHIDVAGMQLGGGAVLQLMPCILPLLLLFLLGRMRAVALDYNPFRTRVRTALPRVGFRTRLLDALAIVVLPLAAAVLAVSSLMIIGQIPALPVLAAVASLVLGAYAFVKLGELQRLMEDVVRSHSVPPPEEQPAST
jgi:hypothetical protein